ncbi:hypothetical protein AR687_15605 [Flavobacteriaceae bacterium CRH]|jgi:hypothetical protein|nr:hypothetical protein AR687_15605 [Flavobacteriaceae bacterium CRH]
MENLNFINPLLHGIIPEELENKALNISAKQLVVAGVGTLIAGAVLKKTGHKKAGAVVAGLALPLLASAIYKKIQRKASEAKANADNSDAITEHA